MEKLQKKIYFCMYLTRKDDISFIDLQKNKRDSPLKLIHFRVKIFPAE